MRIGFDVDGILADFHKQYQALTVKVAGTYLFEPDDVHNPPCWDWPEFRGYSTETMKEVWARIIASPNFWLSLEPHWDRINTLALCIEDLEQSHDVYFVTSRPGQRAKRQTESWLKLYLPYNDEAVHPTVLLASAKGAAAKALKLDAYIDDNLDNVRDVLRESPGTRVYLLNRSYNVGDAFIAVPIGGSVFSPTEIRTAIRVNTLGDMLTAELANI